MKFSNFVFILIIISMCSICLAQNLPKDFLDAHNEARKEVGSKPLTWNETLVEYAQKYADSKKKTCAFEHSMGPYGENLAESFGDLSGLESVKVWLAEKVHYDHELNQCVSDECLHYTQAIWNETQSVGCARSKCDNGWMIVVCEYYPAGNYLGSLPFQ